MFWFLRHVFMKQLCESLFDSLHGVLLAGFSLRGCDDHSVETTRYEMVEDVQVVLDIDSHAMMGNRPGNAYSNRGDFACPNPQPTFTDYPDGPHPEFGKKLDPYGLQD